MDFGLFLEFTAPEGTPDQETFTEGFSLVDAADHYTGNELKVRPKPLQSPHPPIRIGE